jgi:hypothetical protein
MSFSKSGSTLENEASMPWNPGLRRLELKEVYEYGEEYKEY